MRTLENLDRGDEKDASEVVFAEKRFGRGYSVSFEGPRECRGCAVNGDEDREVIQ